MNELLQLFDYNGGKAMYARQLHSALGVQSIFTNWCNRMFEYGFYEGIDYFEVFSQNGINPKGGRRSTDFILTLDCAKEIAMLQRSEAGKRIRKYLIDVETQYRELMTKPAMPPTSTSTSLITQLKLQVQILEQQDQRITAIEQKVVEVEARQTDINTDYFALAGYYHLQQKRFALSNAQAQQTGKRLTAKSAELGYEVKREYSGRYGYVNSYHKYILQAVLGF